MNSATRDDAARAPGSHVPTTERALLAAMEVREPAIRRANGSVLVLLPVPAQIFLYGPFLRLATGRYRLRFRCRAKLALQGRHPVMGLEVIAQNRTLCAWRDYSADELRAGEQQVVFDVPPALGIESGVDAPFEFRFSHFGNAVLEMDHVGLEPLDEGAAAASRAGSTDAAGDVWRLLGRLKTLPSPGGVALSPYSLTRLRLGRLSARLRLPAGSYRLELTCEFKRARRPSGDALEIVVHTRDLQVLGSATVTAEELASGRFSFDIAVPMDASLDVGTPRDIEITIRHRRNAWVRLTGLDLLRLAPGEAPQQPTPQAKPFFARRPQPRNIVIFGNCQAGLISEALGSNPGFARRFSIKHHFLEMASNLHDQGRRDLENCEVMLVQDIRDWDRYPLREQVPSGMPTIRFPCIRFASPWPFDAFNGPDDKLARNHDLPNFEFTYFDGLLGRLRKEIPDLEDRFSAYSSLDVRGVIDFKRLHAFEEKRLLAMDDNFSGGIGAFILDNFRRRQLFYTTAHPNGAVLKMLMKQIAGELGVRQPFWFPGELDSLRRLQVPVHPKVAAALNISWAKPDRTYLVRGEKVTWDAYVRKYIAHYG